MASVKWYDNQMNSFTRKGRITLSTGLNRLIATVMMVAGLLAGCGSAGNSANNGTETGFGISGKINLASGAAVSGITVNLYKSAYIIHSYSSVGGKKFSTMDSNGVESVTIGPLVKSATTDQNGKYGFIGVQSGIYTIHPIPGTYVFKWSQIPTRDNIGVITVTDSGMVYIYNPDGLGNKLSQDGTVIYNIGTPFAITGNALTGQDFEASLPGGI